MSSLSLESEGGLQNGSSDPLGLCSDKETGLEGSSEYLCIHKDSSDKETDRSITLVPPSMKKPKTTGCVYDSSWNTKYPRSLECPQKGKH